MKKNNVLLIAVLMTLLVSFSPHIYASKQKPDTLVIGKISTNPKKHYAYLKPMAQYAADHMEDLGIRKTKVMMAKNVAQLASWMRLGVIDWVTETAYASGFLMAKGNAEPLLLKKKKQQESYHSVIFVRQDSNLTQLSELKGKLMAFEDPSSTSAYYEPALLVLEKNIPLQLLSSHRDVPKKDHLGIVFANQEINISTWVEKGIVDAGAVNNYDWTKEDHVPKSYRQQFKILAKSKEVPRAIEVVRKDLPQKIKQRLKSVLLKAKESEKGKTIMWKYQRTSGFQELTDDQIVFLKNSYKISQEISFSKQGLIQ